MVDMQTDLLDHRLPVPIIFQRFTKNKKRDVLWGIPFSYYAGADQSTLLGFSRP